MTFFFHRTRDRIEVPTTPREVHARLDFAAGALALAIVALAAAGAFGDIHGSVNQRLFAGIGGFVFVVSAVVAIRAAARQVYLVVGARTGPSHAGVLRWLVTVIGYILVLITALGLFAVPIGHLLLGGAVTGVIVGIAAQQALGNVFAGVVLLLSRPFSIGDQIRIRSGSLGGLLDGTVSGMGMTYVTLLTEDGPVSVPNGSLLAAAVGPKPKTVAPPAGPSTGPGVGPRSSNDVPTIEINRPERALR